MINKAKAVTCEKTPEHQARFAELESLELELTDGPVEALRILGPPADPIRLRATIGFLVRSDQHDKAAELISDKIPSDKWIDLAALVYAYIGDIESARNMVAKADEFSDNFITWRTRIAFAEGVLTRWLKQLGRESVLAIPDWSDQDTTLARTVLDILKPPISRVGSNMKIIDELDLITVTYSLQLAYVVGDKVLFDQYATWLIKYTPLPQIIPELCLRRLIECPTNLITRLHIEYPGDFQAGYLAALIESEIYGHWKNSFFAFRDLASQSKSEDEKLMVISKLFETSVRCEVSRIEEAIDVISKLSPLCMRELEVLNVLRLVENGKNSEARRLLDSIRDENDTLWWQTHSQLCERMGDEDGALDGWKRASELLPHPDVIRRCVLTSLKRREYQTAIRGLKKIVSQKPHSEKDLVNLAWTQIQVGDFVKATESYRRLITINSSRVEYKMDLAHCLCRTNRPREAMVVLEQVCQHEDPPLSAILWLSELLAVNEEPIKAFDIIDRIADENWDDPQFLIMYMQRAYGAKKEPQGNNAFARLVELQRLHRVPTELMRAYSVEQFVSIGEERNQRRETLQQMVIDGKAPWLLVEDILGCPSTFAWSLHTQYIKWLSDEPLSRAAFSIYSTNGFALADTDSAKYLTPIQCPSQGTEVVVDLTALITLDQLDMLNEAAEFFGSMVLPISYGDMKLRDAHRFGQHQPSREDIRKRIKKACDYKRISVISFDDEKGFHINEYSEEACGQQYYINDIVKALVSAQKVSQMDLSILQNTSRKERTSDEHNSNIIIGARLIIELTTLYTLANHDIFDVVLGNFQVEITLKDYDTLLEELRNNESAQEAKKINDYIWEEVEQLIDTGKIRWEPIPLKDEHEEEAGPKSSLHLDAMKISLKLGIPLLADDRVLQVLCFHTPPTGKAFGTDQFLIGFLNSRIDSVEKVAAKFRQLMQWRYRFLVPHSDLLLHWARESIGNPPGDALLDTASYLHDCLRDPGLHCGLETCNPPSIMAIRFVRAWTESIIEFLALIWSDDGCPQNSAIRLTQWVGHELFPSCPRGLWFGEIGLRLDRFGPRGALRLAMIHFVDLKDRNRVNLGLRTFSDALGLDEDTFLTTAAEAADVTY